MHKQYFVIAFMKIFGVVKLYLAENSLVKYHLLRYLSLKNGPDQPTRTVLLCIYTLLASSRLRPTKQHLGFKANTLHCADVVIY